MNDKLLKNINKYLKWESIPLLHKYVTGYLEPNARAHRGRVARARIS